MANINLIQFILRFGRKRTLFLCLTLFAVFRTLGFLLAEHFPLFISLSFLAGLVLDPTNSLLSLIAAESTCKGEFIHVSELWFFISRTKKEECGQLKASLVDSVRNFSFSMMCGSSDLLLLSLQYSDIFLPGFYFIVFHLSHRKSFLVVRSSFHSKVIWTTNTA